MDKLLSMIGKAAVAFVAIPICYGIVKGFIDAWMAAHSPEFTTVLAIIITIALPGFWLICSVLWVFSDYIWKEKRPY